MTTQQFCLRWNNHQPNFVASFSNLLNNESLVDVTLAAEGKHIQAHRIVLSACSTYFQTLLSMNACQHPIVILKDVRYKDLRTIVEYMYYGEVNVSEDQLPIILKTAEMLQIKGLTEMPEEKIASNSRSLTVSSETRSLSPAVIRRKRFRKSSTNSGSGSLEHLQGNSEESIEGVIVTSPSPLSQKIETGDSFTSPLNSPPDPSTESESKDLSSKGSLEEDHCSLSQQPSTESNDSRKSGKEDSRPASSSSQSSPQSCIMSEHSNLRPQVVISSPDNSLVPVCSVIPVQPLRNPNRRLNPNQDNVKFQEALEAVRSKKIGFCKAAKMYGVNNRSLWLEYKKRGYPTRPSPKPIPKFDQTSQLNQQNSSSQRNPSSSSSLISSKSVSFSGTTVTNASTSPIVTNAVKDSSPDVYQPQIIPHPPHSYLSPHFDHPALYYASSGDNSVQTTNMVPAHISNLYNMENYYQQQ